MKPQFSRTALVLGEEGISALQKSRVAVFGLGGVGGAVCEALARGGVGALDLVDNDTVSVTNLNHQLIATHQTVGMLKTDAMRDRLLSIDPDLVIRVWPVLALPDNMDQFPFDQYDYVVDAVDSVAAKVALAEQAVRHGVPLISCMGTGNKLDPSRLRIGDIGKTSVCPLARAVRQALRKKGITRLKVLWSDEPPLPPRPLSGAGETLPPGKRSIPGSVPFVPPAAGFMIAGEVIRTLAFAGQEGSDA